jgi:hypothetical protein
MNRKITSALLLLAACYFVFTSYSSGPASNGLNKTGSQGSTAGCGGSGCHNLSSSTTVTLEVDSATTPVTHYIAGNTYTVKIHGVNSASLAAFGFQFSAVKGIGAGQTQAGTYSSIPAGTHTSTVGGLSILEHNSAITGPGGIINLSFQWTAPSAGSGTVTMYSALNAVNQNSNSLGDQYNITSTALTELICTLPAISAQPAATAVCTGSAANFSVTASGGTTYQWKLNGTNISGATSNTYSIASATAANAGNYTVAITNICGTTTSNSVSLTVNALPNPTITQTGFTLTTGTFSSYQWLKNGINIPGATASSYTVTSNGNYTVKVTNANNCTNTSSAVSITNVGVNDFNGKTAGISFYPNPVGNIVNIKYPEKVNIDIRDVANRIVSRQSNVSSIDLSDLPAGVYFAYVTDRSNNSLMVQKLVKK